MRKCENVNGRKLGYEEETKLEITREVLRVRWPTASSGMKKVRK